MADNIQKNKASNLDSIGRNKSVLGKVIKGINAPIGSSDRDNAASIMRSVNKSSPYNKSISKSSPFFSNNTETGNVSNLGTGPLTLPSASYSDFSETPLGKEAERKEAESRGPLKTGSYGLPLDLPDQYQRDSQQQAQEGEQAQQRTEILESPVKRMLSESGFDTQGLADDMTKKEAYDNWYMNLGEDDKKRFKPLYESARQGLGASTFADTMLSSKEKLKQLMPNTPEEELPSGASLVGQLNELERSLKKEYELDNLQETLQDLSEQGITIEDDIEGYMTARDEQIEQVDSLINKSKNQMSTRSDMADPNVKERMGNYMNYLYILKGRQQKRYGDFLESSIDYHNQKLTRAKNDYDTAKSNFQAELENKQALTEEEHKRYKTYLEDMYENLEDQAENKSNLLEEQLKKRLTMYNLGFDVIEAKETSDLLAGGNKLDTDWKKVSQKDKTNAKVKYIQTFEDSDKFSNNSGDASRIWEHIPGHLKFYFLGGDNWEDEMLQGEGREEIIQKGIDKMESNTQETTGGTGEETSGLNMNFNNLSNGFANRRLLLTPSQIRASSNGGTGEETSGLNMNFNNLSNGFANREDYKLEPRNNIEELETTGETAGEEIEVGDENMKFLFKQ